MTSEGQAAGDEANLLRRAARLAGWAARTGLSLGQREVTDETASDRAPLRTAMGQLLESSARLEREVAREYLYATVLRQLTPDEARLLSLLSTGSAYPAVDVVARGNRTVLRNASTIGKAAGVALPDEVPAYLTRLAALGLIDIDGESHELDSQYEILATDELVRAAEEATAGRTKLRRRTVWLSPFGARFWAACDPAG